MKQSTKDEKRSQKVEGNFPTSKCSTLPPAPRTRNPQSSRSQGSALLIALAFIVIISVMLLAYMARTQLAMRASESSAAIMGIDNLAQTAEAAILTDLRQEMLAGSDGTQPPIEGDPMVVTKPWAMVPGRVVKVSADLSNTNFVNLIKQSASGQPFYPGDSLAAFTAKGAAAGTVGYARATAINTAAPSKNERLISPARWNKPALLGGAGFTATNQLPDWILITRNGAATNSTAGAFQNNDPANKDFVIGRYAYNIYDIGGLLDVNVAGYPAANTSDAVAKGSTAWADLSAIPGVSDMQALVDWRNKSSKSDYLAMVQGHELNSTNSIPRPWGESGGFQKPYSTNGVSDNRFFTRQDLIKYRETYGSAALGTNALPYLTTFSADLDQPSFHPDPARPKVQRTAANGGNDAYGDESLPETEQINPPLLSVRDASGDPVVWRRFPLERLKYAYPDPDEPARVAEYFGLTWNALEQAWDYVDGNTIKRLHQIQGREPNMIELLKAAIGTGSLGGQFEGDEPVGSPRRKGFRDASVNYQIIRIAASIIDQYDSDSFPTRIRFGDYEACGDEDLPYIYGMRIVAYQQQVLDPITDMTIPPPPEATGTAPHRSVVMLQPMLWNPHAPPGSPATGDRPTRFRVTAKSGTDIQPRAELIWWPTGNPSPGAGTFYSNWPGTGDLRDLGEPISFSPNSDFMTFSVSSNDSSPAAFREPYTLKSPNFPPGSDAKAFTGGAEFSEPTISTLEQNDPANIDELVNSTIGFRAGWAWAGPWQQTVAADPNTGTPEIPAGSTGNQTYLQEGRMYTNGIDIELQYEWPSGSGQWITYDSYEKYTASFNYWLDRVLSDATTGRNTRYIRIHARVDPRVDRYGARAGGRQVTGTNMAVQGQSLRPGLDEGAELTAAVPSQAVGASTYNFHYSADAGERYWGMISENKPDTPNGWPRYEDPDGVNRVAMGGYSSGSDGLPMAKGNYESRPIILNRPFHSVAELGYVLRDQPWKQLDFFTPESADAALLDMFCLYESESPQSAPLVAGRVNLNTRRSEVIEALLRGVELQAGNTLSDTQTRALAEALVDWTSDSSVNKGPLRNRSELVGKFISGTTYSGFSSTLDSVLSGADKAISMRRQNALKALIDAGTTRTWTFLIDLIVQEGRYAPMVGTLDQFTIRGERRYWVQVAMDRYTGEVVSKLVEVVHE